MAVDDERRLTDIVEVKKIHLMWRYCTNMFVCFVEEVILADDENENDYDGMNSLCLCIHNCN